MLSLCGDMLSPFAHLFFLFYGMVIIDYEYYICYFQKCCYNTVSPDGPLLVDVAGSGYLYLYNPLVDPALSYSADTVPYTWCCVNAGLCDVFFNQRNSDNCLTYKPPESGMNKLEVENILYPDIHVPTH